MQIIKIQDLKAKGRYLKIEKYLKNKKGSVLEIGCANGIFKWMEKNGWKCLGVDRPRIWLIMVLKNLI